MLNAVFILWTMCGNVLRFSSMALCTQPSISLTASGLIFWSFAASNLSWHTTNDLFSLSYIQTETQESSVHHHLLCISIRGDILNYLKLSHFILEMMLRFNNGDTAVLDAVTYLLLIPSSVKALVRAFEISLLHNNETEFWFIMNIHIHVNSILRDL